jgi:hypothetical protein
MLDAKLASPSDVDLHVGEIIGNISPQYPPIYAILPYHHKSLMDLGVNVSKSLPQL